MGEKLAAFQDIMTVCQRVARMWNVLFILSDTLGAACENMRRDAFQEAGQHAGGAGEQKAGA